MTRKLYSLWLLILGLLLALVLVLGVVNGAAEAGPALAGLSLSWWTADAGGALNLANGVYSLSGTAGQPDANAPVTAGIYRLSPGFWPGAVASFKIYLPAVMR